MDNQTIDNILEQLNKLPLREGQPYLLVKKKKPACYVIKNYAKTTLGREEFDIDIISIPRSKIEELAEKALISGSKEATLEANAERCVHKESYGGAIYNHQGCALKKTQVQVELYLKLSQSNPEFKLKYEIAKK